MPDITMCPSDTCPKRTECYRNEASGTEPTPWRQSYFTHMTVEGEDCEYFVLVRKEPTDAD